MKFLNIILNDMQWWFFFHRISYEYIGLLVQSDRTNKSAEIGQTNVFFLWNIDINGPLWNSITLRKP